MNCPSCLKIMTNRDERHHVHPDSYRMNLLCHNLEYDPAKPRNLPKRLCPAPFTVHMGVIVPPSYSNQEWICDHYHLPFRHKNNWFILCATPSTPEISLFDNHWILVHGQKFTQILKDYQSPPIIQVPFIPISTNNDMHQHAKSIFDRLMSLIAFS